jgi:hypothetical protein
VSGDVRANLRRLLALLSDPEAQRAFERDVPAAHVPSELVCLWFDDVYRPDDAAFRAAFSEAERRALDAFHRLYREREPDLEPLPETVRDLHALPAWSDVVRAAGTALGALEAESKGPTI